MMVRLHIDRLAVIKLVWFYGYLGLGAERLHLEDLAEDHTSSATRGTSKIGDCGSFNPA